MPTENLLAGKEDCGPGPPPHPQSKRDDRSILATGTRAASAWGSSERPPAKLGVVVPAPAPPWGVTFHPTR